jgi:hypothetical protein
MSRLAVLCAAALAFACKSEPPPPAGEGPGAPPPPPVVAPAGSTAYVSAVSLLRREPSDAPRVKGANGKEISNLIATLQRGEKVVVLEEAARVVGKDEWAHVKSSDDREGWLKRSSLIEGEGVGEATVLVPADVFDRPDLLAANARRKIEPGTLLLVVKVRAPFSEVNVSSGPNAWVLTDRLASGDAEVSVAKLAEKARWLKRNGKGDEALAILELARSTFPGQPLVELLAAELAPPEGGEIVPVSTETGPSDARWDSGR